MLRFRNQILSKTFWRSPHSISYRSLSSQAEKDKLFDKVLIANRGEIACRVIRSCQKLGIKTVAIYSEPDANSVAVNMADEAYCVGPAPSVDSYLSIPNIMEVIRKTGAQAVHPGYGFLSENKLFCEALEAEGVTFIGPGHHAIEAMGDKIESKQIAIKAGVNTIPGFLGIMQDEDEVVKVARDIGYPVMIKASAGGGGKGMRVAYNDEEAKLGFRLSKEEAASSFGDDRIFVEKFIEDPRHIEIQLLADKHGNVVPFPERECSIQRRNQKVVEEAPSVLLDEETRLAMGAQAKMLAEAVGYVSAGTVEFLCDKHKNFYFLEMNTRLQVEHPVTEYITKVDLVEQMLRIAAGHPLPAELTQGPLKIHGWAMESRVYAEDPLRGFLPSIGRLLKYQEPHHLKDVRVDSGVVEGSDISMFYDPMISKLVTHGKDREDCLQRMQAALDHYVIRGPGNNLCFLQDVYRHPRFQQGNITTKFIEEEYPGGFSGVQLTPLENREVMAGGLMFYLEQLVVEKTITGQLKTSCQDLSSTMTKHEQLSLEYLIKNEDIAVARSPSSSTNCCTHGFQIPSYLVTSTNCSPQKVADYLASNHLEELQKLYISTSGPFGDASPVRLAQIVYPREHGAQEVYTLMQLEGKKECVLVSNASMNLDSGILKASMEDEKISDSSTYSTAMQILKNLPEGFRIQHHGAIHDVIIRTEKEHEYAQYMVPKPEVDTTKFLQCPMPGMLISVSVEEGQKVEIGQELAIVEAMKMQNILRAERKGVVSKICHQAGESLKTDQVILEFE